MHFPWISCKVFAWEAKALLHGCAGSQAFTRFQLTTLGNAGPNGPTSVAGYASSPPPACPVYATQLVQPGNVAIVPTGSGVQRFTVPTTGTYRLDVTGERAMPTINLW